MSTTNRSRHPFPETTKPRYNELVWKEFWLRQAEFRGLAPVVIAEHRTFFNRISFASNGFQIHCERILHFVMQFIECLTCLVTHDNECLTASSLTEDNERVAKWSYIVRLEVMFDWFLRNAEPLKHHQQRNVTFQKVYPQPNMHGFCRSLNLRLLFTTWMWFQFWKKPNKFGKRYSPWSGNGIDRESLQKNAFYSFNDMLQTILFRIF